MDSKEKNNKAGGTRCKNYSRQHNQTQMILDNDIIKDYKTIVLTMFE